MNITVLGYIGLGIGFLGVVLIVVASCYFVYRLKKFDVNDIEFIQTSLRNTDVSIGEAVKYLKIVNSYEDVINTNEQV